MEEVGVSAAKAATVATLVMAKKERRARSTVKMDPGRAEMVVRRAWADTEEPEETAATAAPSFS